MYRGFLTLASIMLKSSSLMRIVSWSSSLLQSRLNLSIMFQLSMMLLMAMVFAFIVVGVVGVISVVFDSLDDALQAVYIVAQLEDCLRGIVGEAVGVAIHVFDFLEEIYFIAEFKEALDGGFGFFYLFFGEEVFVCFHFVVVGGLGLGSLSDIKVNILF